MTDLEISTMVENIVSSYDIWAYDFVQITLELFGNGSYSFVIFLFLFLLFAFFVKIIIRLFI